jgi:prophage antirepressor-like protein
MDFLGAFVFNNTHHEVNILLDKNDDRLFQASDIGKVLSISNVHTSILDFDGEEKVLRTSRTRGGDQECTFLTEQGVYKLIMRSRKPIAKPFQKWVFNAMKTTRKTGRYELQLEIDRIQSDHDQELRKLFREYRDTEDERMHKTLVEGFDDKTVVYFGKIKTMDDDRVLVKIGCTKNIRPRATSLKTEFGNMSIFRVIECDHHESFERFLHNHQDIRRYSYKELVNGTKKSQEVFLMTEAEVKRAVNIATRNVSQFRVNKKRDFDEMVATNPTVRALCERVGVPVHEDVDSLDIAYENKRGRCSLHGPKIQAYSEDGSRLIQTYDILIDAVREFVSDGASQEGIRKACRNKIVKYGHRWAELGRSEPNDKVQDIGETMEDLTTLKTGLVAGMNDDKTEVMKVYTSYKTCGEENGFLFNGGVQKRVKKGVKVGGHHIVRWVEIPEEVQDKWLENNQLPQVKKQSASIKINRLDPVTSTVLKTYGTMNEVKIHYKIGQHALKNAIKGNTVKRGFKWAYAT